MRISVLFSGGKDSSLSALLMEPFFEIELVTFSFGLLPNGELAEKTAKRLGFPHRVLSLEWEVLEKAYEKIMKDGFPKSAINYIHEKAVETLASDPEVKFIADGTRRDDRVPVLSISQVRSIEDRLGVQYICPLKGYGKKTVSILVERYLKIEEGPSENTQKADYETELRELIRQRDGKEKIKELFPSHIQSHVLSRKNCKSRP
ncbi:tRNA(5-methylaminomethyl-2-thiouridylate) methyltransferase [Methanosarcina spelaei]|jgi:predicted subunit of tRNA(5-methylaminomethyl-2-thiouridylate) methyltransferase|uniref:tRNA(5-methylaminomethyl-2-thiouridylate) methyltransferase n=1 Tax=Methanosarcina spelaei TaxID=1036679 RepID=A0A2A2HY60_9EURY|nr:asparagine synthase-related protein [Methanosarcina spelaei]PAV14357.1 tRNA(5-methylaminomethyl-2-thiouridylate) methyltransferase [Methanosarcina spelaei]